MVDANANVVGTDDDRPQHQHKEKNAAPHGGNIPSNEYVLNVAFLSFLLFTTLQLFFALIAKSQAMMTDCAAMYVDVITYFFNWLAERLKHHHNLVGGGTGGNCEHDDNRASARSTSTSSSTSETTRKKRLARLYLEMFPPFFSVLTLIVVTIIALKTAFETLILPRSATDPPNLLLMLLFSALNLVLDFVNVTCFARVSETWGLGGLSSSHGREEGTDYHLHHSDRPHCHSNEDKNATRTSPSTATATTEANESTPLVMQRRNSPTPSNTPSEDSEASGGLNLNMCSAWTHIAADTLRSIAVLLAAGFAHVFPSLLSPIEADSWSSVVVSVIILLSLTPLIQQLYFTACKIRDISTGQDHYYCDTHNQHHRREIVLVV